MLNFGCSPSISSEFGMQPVNIKRIWRAACQYQAIGAFSPIGCPAMPDWLTQSGQCRTKANLGIMACRLPLFPDCPIGWCSPYYRLQSTDCFIDSIHWPVHTSRQFAPTHQHPEMGRLGPPCMNSRVIYEPDLEQQQVLNNLS